jgi:CheY-like chemotaxis protein
VRRHGEHAAAMGLKSIGRSCRLRMLLLPASQIVGAALVARTLRLWHEGVRMVERTQPRPDVVAVINTSPDVVDMLRFAFQPAGIVIVGAFTYDIRDGRIDIEAFMRQHSPRVILYDVAPPYETNWQLFQHVRTMPAMQHAQFILTSTNPAAIARLFGAAQRVFEVIGKPYDLDQIILATKEALRARPTR